MRSGNTTDNIQNPKSGIEGDPEPYASLNISKKDNGLRWGSMGKGTSNVTGSQTTAVEG